MGSAPPGRSSGSLACAGRTESLEEAEQLKAELETRARSQSEQIVQKARAQIGREKDQAIRELRAQVADIAVEAAAKIVTSSLTPEAQKKLVKEFIEGLPKAPS